MPSLQSYLAGRMADGGLGQPGLLQASMTLTSFASLGTVETFREGLFASLRSSMVGGRDDGVFRLSPEAPPAKNAGPSGDTVPGGAGTSFVLTVGGAAQQGFVNTVGDDDWYRVTLTAGQTYIFTLNGSGATPLQDPYLELYNSFGGLIAFDDDFGSGINALLRFTVSLALPVLAGVRNLRDVDYAVSLGAGNPGVGEWYVFGKDKYKFELGGGSTGVIAPGLYPLLRSGQINGLIGGLRGAAEYESLIGQKGRAVAGMDAQSATHLAIIVLVVICNLFYFSLRHRRGQSELR